ncbi:DUF4198 domain-containing protein [Thiocapsa imhoffii]|nr:DUF4198 domain-containing protein [Thiocapsa imhoffii]
MMNHVTMTSVAVPAALLAVALSGSAQAHFQLLYTPNTMLDTPGDVPLRLVFAHPMDNGHVMDMGEPVELFVVFRGEKTDLADALEPVSWTGAHNQATAYALDYRVTRNGDYVFALIPSPYFEASEDAYIQQITKTYLNKGAMPTGWDEPLGLPTEIVPLNKPYQILAGGTFSGQLLSEGEPAAGVECEVEWLNTTIDVAANAFGAETRMAAPPTPIVTRTDANGVFTFGVPKPGVWGFACLGSGPVTEFDGKELSQDAVIWVNAIALE